MEFNNLLEKYGKIANTELFNFFDGMSKNIDDGFLMRCYDLLKGFCLRPGKRLRPIISIMSCKGFDCSDESMIYPLCIVPELIHAASLIHDDLMDDDDLRRGKPTMHKIFEDKFNKDLNQGNIVCQNNLGPNNISSSLAILQGNILNSMSIYPIIDSSLDPVIKNNCIKVFNEAFIATNHGQIKDILFSCKREILEKEYLDTALRKTGPLLKASIKLGGILANAGKYQLEYMDKYAEKIALAFQIHDDLLDIDKCTEKGRVYGSDIRKGNMTLLTIKALENCSAEQKLILLDILGKNDCSDAEIDRAIKIFEESGAINYSKEYSRKLIDDSKEFLKKVDMNKEGYEFFSRFADYLVERKK